MQTKLLALGLLLLLSACAGSSEYAGARADLNDTDARSGYIVPGYNAPVYPYAGTYGMHDDERFQPPVSQRKPFPPRDWWPD